MVDEDDEDEGSIHRRLSPGRITALAVAASVVLIAAAAAAATATTVTAAPPPSTVTPAPPPPPTRTQPPAQVTLPMDGYGFVHVRTLSGKTVCALTADDVQCNVRFTNRHGPIDKPGNPVSGVAVNSRGAFQWLDGDPGNPDYVTMAYGTVYNAMGWIITPTSQGTTFMYDATGHGMTVSVDGVSPF
jgi:hypothetical protein